MSLSATVNYDTPGNFSYDSSLISVADGVAALKLQDDAGKVFTQAFSSASGFTYDSSKAEFTGGVVRQKSQRPTDSTFGAKFSAVVAGNFGDGDLTATITGSAAIFNNKLQLEGGGKYVSFDAADNVDTLDMVGTLRFRMTPAYNGTPVANQAFLTIGAGNENKIALFHATNGSFFVLFNDDTGTNQISNSVASYSAVAGEEVEVELSWDLSAGTPLVRFFGAGYLVAEIAAPFTRDATSVTTFQIGDNDANFSIRDLVFFSTVQHTANYTAGEYTLPAGDYVESAVTLPANSYTGPGTVQAFTDFSATVAGSPRFVIDGKYWTGSAWAASDSSYDEASSAANVIANIDTLEPSASNFVVKAIFGDGNTRASVDALTVEYTGQIYPTTNPTIVPNAPIMLDAMSSFSAELTAGGSDAIKFTLGIAAAAGGSYTDYYWNGSAWASTNSTYTQTNTAAELLAHVATLGSLVTDGARMRVKAWLHSAAGLTTPEIESHAFDYDFFIAPTAPAECLVYGFVLDVEGDPIPTATVKVTNTAAFYHSGNMIAAGSKTIDVDDDGYWEVSLVETETVDATYDFQVITDKTKKYSKVTVPALDSAALADIT